MTKAEQDLLEMMNSFNRLSKAFDTMKESYVSLEASNKVLSIVCKEQEEIIRKQKYIIAEFTEEY
jgi:hypothetical protein